MRQYFQQISKTCSDFSQKWMNNDCKKCEWESQVFYDTVDFKISDHKPVVSYFSLQVKKVDKSKKDKVIRQVYDVSQEIYCLFIIWF